MDRQKGQKGVYRKRLNLARGTDAPLCHGRIIQQSSRSTWIFFFLLCGIITLTRRSDDSVKVQSASFGSGVFSSQPDEHREY